MTAHALPQRNVRPSARGRLMLPLALLALLVLGAGTFVSLVLWPTWPSAAVPLDAPAMPITVANVLFHLPPASVPARRPAPIGREAGHLPARAAAGHRRGHAALSARLARRLAWRRRRRRPAAGAIASAAKLTARQRRVPTPRARPA